MHLGGSIAAQMRARPDEEHGPADAKGQHDLAAQRQPQPRIDAHSQRQVACAAGFAPHLQWMCLNVRRNEPPGSEPATAGKRATPSERCPAHPGRWWALGEVPCQPQQAVLHQTLRQPTAPEDVSTLADPAPGILRCRYAHMAGSSQT